MGKMIKQLYTPSTNSYKILPRYFTKYAVEIF